VLMRDMLVAGGAEGGKYGEAMSIYSQIYKKSAVLQASPRVGADALWDDRDQKSVLHRLALGTAVAHAVPINMRWGNRVSVDAVARYFYFEAAYKAGELDPAFEVLTAWELSYSVRFTGEDSEMTWLRDTMYNTRPTAIVSSDYHDRYAAAVHSDVAYGDSVWPDGSPAYHDIPAAGGVCGPRAFFGRLCRRSFGLPTWGTAQPGHAAMTTWAPQGWAVLLGAGWAYCFFGDYTGPPFYLESQCREKRADYQRVLRGQWGAAAVGEAPVSKRWTPRSPTSYGTGGNWSALALYASKIATTDPAPTREIGPSVVPTKVAALIARWPQPEPTPNVTVGPDGSITLPAVAYTKTAYRAPITAEKSADGGMQLNYGSGNFIKPNATTVEYVVDSAEGGMFYFTANISTWHVNTDLQLTTNTTKAPLEIPVFYTVGYWKETQPVEVRLLKGRNVLQFERQLGASLNIKEFFLLKQKPIVPPPPSNHTPAPAPPTIDSYIQLSEGLTCTSQGIKDLSDSECGYAAAHFGFKYTGARQREFMTGCWALVSGPYAGNSNLNTNSSAVCCAPDQRALCLRV